MADDERTRLDPLAAGLGLRYTQGDLINHGQWQRARAERGVVGTCRLCGGHMTPAPSEDRCGPVEWYEAECILCHHTIASPGGRVLRRSSRFSEQPVEWRETRMARLTEGH